MSQEVDVETRRAQFIEEFGGLFEQVGGSRMIGRVIGLLTIAEPPERTAEQLASELQASRGSISQATRQLVRLGMVQRFTKPGERRDYFRLRRNAWVETTRVEIRLITTYRDLIQSGLSLVGENSVETRRNMEHAVEFFDYWNQEYQRFLETWDQLQKDKQ